MAPRLDNRTIYASEKVREVVRDHEDEIRAVVPKIRTKIVVLGDSGVGKTSIIYRHRFQEGNPIPFNATIGASFVSLDVETTAEDVVLQIWDTAGQERFRCMVPMYMRNATAAIIVYDVTSRQSFDNVDKWSEELHNCCGMVDPVIVLIGNKGDLEERREVATGEGAAKANRLNARFYELSADAPTDFTHVLEELAEDLVSGRCSAIIAAKPSTPPISLSPAPADEVEEIEVVKRKQCCSLL